LNGFRKIILVEGSEFLITKGFEQEFTDLVLHFLMGDNSSEVDKGGSDSRVTGHRDNPRRSKTQSLKGGCVFVFRALISSGSATESQASPTPTKDIE
jgi:hypothetical protein